jgi:hypothetical protein
MELGDAFIKVMLWWEIKKLLYGLVGTILMVVCNLQLLTNNVRVMLRFSMNHPWQK